MKLWELDNAHGTQYKDNYGYLWIFDDCGYLVSNDGRDITAMYSSKDLLFVSFESWIDWTDWTTVAVDTPIYVRENPSDEWQKRHFASFHDRKIYAYLHGLTSWTADPRHAVDYKYAKLS